MVVQKFRSSEDCTDSRKLVNTCRQLKNIPAKLDKTTNKEKGKNFAKTEDFLICDVGCEIASSVTARYYKGISAHKDNLVIVRTE